MKITAVASCPPDKDGKTQPVSLTIEATDDTGGKLLGLNVPDAAQIAAILPRLLALTSLLPKPKK